MIDKFEDYRKLLMSIGLQRKKEYNLMQDAIQETWITFNAKLKSGYKFDNVKFWLIRVCMNHYFRLYYRGSNFEKSKTIKEGYNLEYAESETKDCTVIKYIPSLETPLNLCIASDMRSSIEKSTSINSNILLMNIDGYSIKELCTKFNKEEKIIQANLYRGRKDFKKKFNLKINAKGSNR